MVRTRVGERVEGRVVHSCLVPTPVVTCLKLGGGETIKANPGAKIFRAKIFRVILYHLEGSGLGLGIPGEGYETPGKLPVASTPVAS
eukprot:4387951-Pyramimonas_sp.AAC.2